MVLSIFQPKWKHPNIDVRKKAVSKITNLKKLYWIALNKEEADSVRKVAISNLATRTYGNKNFTSKTFFRYILESELHKSDDKKIHFEALIVLYLLISEKKNKIIEFCKKRFEEIKNNNDTVFIYVLNKFNDLLSSNVFQIYDLEFQIRSEIYDNDFFSDPDKLKRSTIIIENEQLIQILVKYCSNFKLRRYGILITTDVSNLEFVINNENIVQLKWLAAKKLNNSNSYVKVALSDFEKDKNKPDFFSAQREQQSKDLEYKAKALMEIKERHTLLNTLELISKQGINTVFKIFTGGHCSICGASLIGDVGRYGCKHNWIDHWDEIDFNVFWKFENDGSRNKTRIELEIK
jgi:hypothetical protein